MPVNEFFSDFLVSTFKVSKTLHYSLTTHFVSIIQILFNKISQMSQNLLFLTQADTNTKEASDSFHSFETDTTDYQTDRAPSSLSSLSDNLSNNLSTIFIC